MNNQIYSKIKTDDEAREAIFKGMTEVHKAVAPTLGASGRNSVYRDFIPTITNDGVSIARRIQPRDHFESMGADLIKQAAEETNTEAGDGTTTSIVLAHSLVEASIEALKSGRNPMVLRRELEEAKNEVIAKIKEKATPIKDEKDIFNVAKISVEDDRLAEIVSSAVEKAGDKGQILVEEGSGYDVEVDESKGYFWERGYVSPYFATNEKGEAELEDVSVIVTDRYMNRNLELMKTLNSVHEKGVKSVLIICDRMDGELLQTLVVNKMKGLLNICVVTRPPSDEELEDIASITMGTAITKDKGIREITSAHVGKARKVIATKDKVTILTDESPARDERVQKLETQLEEDTDNETLQARISKLTDGIVLLRVGAKTESERKYKKLKMDDAVCAVRSAKEEGIVPGAGLLLKEISEEIENEIMKKALIQPYNRVLENAGIKPDGKSYNVLTCKVVKDILKEGIIDPAKVTRSAVENSVSLAGTVLTLSSVVAHYQEKESQESDSSNWA